MATATQQKVKPRLNSLDDLLKLNAEGSGNVVQALPQSTEAATDHQPPPNTEYAMVPFELMGDYPGHPFRRYTGQRKTDMVESIKEHGILQPLLLRPTEDGRYHIMAGHNRRDNGQEAGLAQGPCVIKHNLTDEEAWVYVIETNLIQRSFSDMLPSEQAAVIALRHSKMVSQGQRSDILAEIASIENPDGSREKSTSDGNPQKFSSRETLANEYGLKPNRIALLLRTNRLIDSLKERLDNEEFMLSVASDISFLSAKEQRALDKCIELNGFKVDGKKADTLREYSKSNKLNDDNIYLVLSGEVGRPPKKNRTPTVKVSKDVYSRYFTPDQSAKEVQEHVETALEFYHNHLQNQSREVESASQHPPGYQPDADGIGLDEDEESDMEL